MWCWRSLSKASMWQTLSKWCLTWTPCTVCTASSQASLAFLTPAYPEQKCSNWISRDVEPSACSLHDTCVRHLHPSFPVLPNSRSTRPSIYLYHFSFFYTHNTSLCAQATEKNTQVHQRAYSWFSYFCFPSAGDMDMTYGTWLKTMKEPSAKILKSHYSSFPTY